MEKCRDISVEVVNTASILLRESEDLKMKKLLCLLMSVVLLTGCSAKKQEEEIKYDEPVSENVATEEILYEATTVEDIFGEDIFTSDEIISHEDSEIMSPAEVIDKAVTSLNSGCTPSFIVCSPLS